MSNFVIIGFLSEQEEEGVSIAILMEPDRSIVKLVAMRNGKKIEGTIEVKLTSKDFDRLLYDYPDLTERKYYVYGLCKVNKNVLYPNTFRTVPRNHRTLEHVFIHILFLICISGILACLLFGLGKFVLYIVELFSWP